jgi:nucleoredoxin
MQSVLGDVFINRDGEVPFSEVDKNQVVCLYFTAHWCPPCRAFTPILVEFYNDVNYPEKRMEVIQVSSDKDQEQFNEYFGPLPWLAIPFNDPRLKNLKTQFNIKGIPVLILLNRDGTLALGSARADVQNEGPACFEKWTKLVN